ncbi:hypothetical protein LTR36_004707 [Oleoguttula mirabilis]|uniref:Uncharacterized protein n=1 Tax=Oleoguttula mirabilis TaxID=1507867 RepID=A0AAV9JFA5_9PEZI|nr:hypothetical protein LTR36_004707 [Oleoguttula mirabilis]
MRFQDWDVLLFPNGSQVPIREFRTACFAQQDGLTATPLLTCFVPSLEPNAAFQISMHSWTKPMSILGPNAGYATGTDYVWRIKIAVDGLVTVNETFPETITWPRQLDTASALGPTEKLAFPKFHRSILSQSHWNASEEKGRIKVQLSAGYMLPQDGKPQFVKLVDYVVFSFQPAPMDILERSGIAWPNPSLQIVNNLLQPPEAQARQVSIGGLPILDDGSSRSTSAYSTYSPAAYPPMHMTAPYPVPYASIMGAPMGAQHVGAHAMSHEAMKLRLPTGQLQTLINAMSPPKPVSNTSMLPPPLPQSQQHHHYLTMPTSLMAPVADRRGDSRYSDTSMHAGCTSFPSCLTEDAEGHLQHTNGPATVVKGRKEGSSPSKPRDFLSTVMDAPAPSVAALTDVSSPVTSSASAKKRTRSALRTLTLNDGSPEKKEKPPRKVSRASTAGSDKSDKENMMVE